MFKRDEISKSQRVAEILFKNPSLMSVSSTLRHRKVNDILGKGNGVATATVNNVVLGLRAVQETAKPSFAMNFTNSLQKVRGMKEVVDKAGGVTNLKNLLMFIQEVGGVDEFMKALDAYDEVFAQGE